MRVVDTFYRVKSRDGKPLVEVGDEMIAIQQAIAVDGSYDTVKWVEEVTEHQITGS